MAEREEMAFLFYMLIGGAMVCGMAIFVIILVSFFVISWIGIFVLSLSPIMLLLFVFHVWRAYPLRTMFGVIVLALLAGSILEWRADLKTQLGRSEANLARDLLATRLALTEKVHFCEEEQLHLRSSLIARDLELEEMFSELLRSNQYLSRCCFPNKRPISCSRRLLAERGETHFGSWSSEGSNVVRPRRVSSHWQNRIPSQQQVDASHRDNGRVIPWWSIFVEFLLALSLCFTVVLRSWHTDLKTQFNRSEKQAHNLASDLRTTQLDLAGKLQELDDSEVEQHRLRTNLAARDLQLAETKRELLDLRSNLTARDLELAETKRELLDLRSNLTARDLQLVESERELLDLRSNLTARDRELEETKRELQRSDQHQSSHQHVRNCIALNKQLKSSVRLLNHSADAAAQREQRQTKLMCESEKKLLLILDTALRRVDEAEREVAEGRAGEEERQHQQQGVSADKRKEKRLLNELLDSMWREGWEERLMDSACDGATKLAMKEAWSLGKPVMILLLKMMLPGWLSILI